MKRIPIEKLRLIGLATVASQLVYYAKCLAAGTQPSPAVTVKEATAAIAAVPAVVGTGTVAAPQFPAVPAKPAMPAIKSPVIVPVANYLGSFLIEKMAGFTKIKGVLPVAPALEAMGKPLSAASIGEITPPTLQLDWYGSLDGVSPTNQAETLIDGKAPTVEQAFYLAMSNPLLPTMPTMPNKMDKALYSNTPTSPKIAVIAFELYVPDEAPPMQ